MNPNYWYIKGQAYDFSEYCNKHPGGWKAIMVGKGIDCTCLFMSYHPRLPSQKLLDKYKVEGETVQTATNGFGFRFEKKENLAEKQGFYDELWKEANAYLKTAGGRTGGSLAVVTWLLNMLLIFTATYFGFFKGQWWAAALFGVGKSLLVVRATHACSHYSFTKYPVFNQVVYGVCMAISGDTPGQWTAKHVVSHHIDCNVAHLDDDTMYPIKRALPDYPRMWFHAYQCFYIWIMYFVVFIPWTLSHNIKFLLGLLPGGKIWEGLAEVKHHRWQDWVESVFCIVGQWCVRAIPFVFLDWSDAWKVFWVAEMTSSLWFSLQFAVNHEVVGAVQHSGLQFDGKRAVYPRKRDWGVHQVVTSNGYSVDGHLALHLSGGLNTQIEHHLFPSVHYKHYHALSKIVRRMCKKYDIPYSATPSFFGSVCEHMKLLWHLGRNDDLPGGVNIVA